MIIILWYTAHECPLCALLAAMHIGIPTSSPPSTRVLRFEPYILRSLSHHRLYSAIIVHCFLDCVHFLSFRIRDRVYIIIHKGIGTREMQRYEMCISLQQFDRTFYIDSIWNDYKVWSTSYILWTRVRWLLSTYIIL
jgi:hypothetical protein